MPDATGQRVSLLSLTSSIVAIVCLAIPESLQDANTVTGPAAAARASFANYLVPNETYSKLAEQEAATDAHLLSILDGIGPDMKPANGFVDPPNITLDVATRAWQLMHSHARRFASERIDFVWPVVRQTLVEANVSGQCLAAAEQVASSARKLESWAVKLLNSWGSFPPVGLFEGTLGDIGSYHGCLEVPQNAAIRHAHYCSFSFRPVLPTRADYELIITPEPAALLDLFNETDSFRELAGKSQYNHYVYFKLGVCFPIDCSPVDAQRVARLLARRAILMSGPVKCHSRFEDDYAEAQTGRALRISSQDLNNGIYIWKPQVNRAQVVALICLGALSALVLSFTLADLVLNYLPKMRHDLNSTRTGDVPNGHGPGADEELRLGALTVMKQVADEPAAQPLTAATPEVHVNGNGTAPAAHGHQPGAHDGRQESGGREADKKSLLGQLVHDCSLITNCGEFVHVSKQQLRSDILCMNGLRCITMSWIILAHTIQYNDWSAFARIYKIEEHLLSLANQPVFNASYLVDTFFVMSGLLTSYSVFKTERAFSAKSFLVGRYLRLTPQILLVSLLFILLPLSSSAGGPHWDSMTGEYSENCSNNWWVNLLHIQAFYKSGEMCNFVCWWISVDMFYHVLALAVILVILRASARAVVGLCSALALVNAAVQAASHYQLGLPPNLLSTIPQTGAMWSQMTLRYFWRPSAHLLPFALGFQLGFFLARSKRAISAWFTGARALAGWLAAVGLFGCVLFGTQPWVAGRRYAAWAATAWALAAQAVWSLCVAWTIVACQHGRGGFINRMLSCKLFIVLGRASYLVYLSHFLVLFSFFGSQNLLLEPTRILIVYIIVGNVCLSMALGSLLCVAFEMPWLKLQKRIMRLVDCR